MRIKIDIGNLAEERVKYIRSEVRRFCEKLTQAHGYENGVEFDFDFDVEAEEDRDDA